MKSFVLMVASAAVFAATGVPASAADKASDQAQSNNSEKKICRRDSAGTGSIMSKRICRTKAEWDALEAQAQRDLERTQNMDRARSMAGH